MVQAPAVFETTALVRAWLPQQQIYFVKSLIKGFFISLSIPVNIKVKLSRTKETKQLKIKEGSTIKDLLKTINLKPDTVIILNKETPIPIDDELKDKQEIIVINVSSGG